MKLEQETRMKFDDEIDAALQLLRKVQPPAAMESRLQRCLETAAAKSQRSGLGSFFWIPVAGAAMAGVLLLAFSLGHGTTGKQSHAVEPVKMVTPVSRGTAAAPMSLVSMATSHRRKSVAQAAAVRRVRREHPQYRHVANLLSYPLTRQEKLLVQFAQAAKPEDLKALNPEYQAKVEAQREAEFAAYLKSGDGSRTQETTN
jgi:hypothetical protein